MDAKYDKANLPSIVKNNCAHLSTSHCNSLLALLLKFDPVPLEIPTNVCAVHIIKEAVRLKSCSHHQTARGVDACITRAPLVAVAQTCSP